MKKALALVVFALLCGATTTVDAQRPSTTKTISTTRLADVSETVETVESFSLDADYEMFVTPVVADIKLLYADASGACKHSYFKGTNRSDGKTGKQYTLPKRGSGKSAFFDYETLKGQVIFDFCRECDADVIVLPQFSARNARYTKDGVDAEGNPYKAGDPIEENGSYVMEVEMLGFPAVYTSFRPAKATDQWIKSSLMMGPTHRDEERRQIVEEITKRQKE